MPFPNNVSAFQSQPVPEESETNCEEDTSFLPKPKARKRVEGTSIRPVKRITSSNSLENFSQQPLIKNIKYFTSKKLRSISSSSSSSEPQTQRELKLKQQEISLKLVTDLTKTPTTPPSSSPSNRRIVPGLSYDDTPDLNISPDTPRHYFGEDRDCHFRRKLDFGGSSATPQQQVNASCHSPTDELNLELLSIQPAASSPVTHEPLHRIFQIPEIMHRILNIYDLQNSVIPHEAPPIRRVPLSYEHALLIHKDEQVAKDIWEESQQIMKKGNDTVAKHALYDCMFVNRLWHEIATDLINKNCYFDSDTKWLKYAKQVNKAIHNEAPKPYSPTTFVLHKLTHIKQRHLELVMNWQNLENLKWLEFYICPTILPSSKMFLNSKNLSKIVITGSKTLSDEFMIKWAPHLPNLQFLDLRACESITDSSIYTIAMHCPNLQLLNVGRQTRGDLVTDASICPIIRNTKISTLGVAGCGISDRSIWELAINKADTLERLSLNNCHRLTNQSLPRVIHFFKKLSVLEIRHCLQITNIRPLVEFKRTQMAQKINVLVEGCEVIEKLIREEEIKLDSEISKNVLEDIREWCNSASDIEH